MVVAERIQHYVRRLPERLQTEVLDFVEFLMAKSEKDGGAEADDQWPGLSLSAAMRGMEDEDAPEYSLSDMKESFQ